MTSVCFAFKMGSTIKEKNMLLGCKFFLLELTQIYKGDEIKEMEYIYM